MRRTLNTQKLTRKQARWSLLLHKHDFTVVHWAGTENANVECLSRHLLLATHGAPILDWNRGDYNEAPTSYFAMTADVAASPLIDPSEREV